MAGDKYTAAEQATKNAANIAAEWHQKKSSGAHSSEMEKALKEISNRHSKAVTEANRLWGIYLDDCRRKNATAKYKPGVGSIG